MKSLLIAFLFFSINLFAQETIVINLNGISSSVCQQMKKNNDRISWYIPDGGKKVSINLVIELLNPGMKSGDKGRFGLQADPDAEGNYRFDAKFDVKVRKIDKTKPITIKIMAETILGNEVFCIEEREFSKIAEPFVFKGYMWRADNEKIQPEKRLCLEFSSFINDPVLRKKAADDEGFPKFEVKDFQLFLKQSEKADWKIFPEPLQGKISNGNSVGLTNPLPSWIDPTKKLWVRFSVKTPKGNFIWDEYTVEPNEYRKEQRARNFSGAAFDNSVPLK